MNADYMAVLGLSLGLVAQFVVVAYLYGRLTEKVRGQGEWIERVESSSREGFVRIQTSIDDMRKDFNNQMGGLHTALFARMNKD
jgi:hypothetical protein